MKCLAFDIEISNVFTLNSGEDLEKYAPFDISVAATQIADGEHRIWHSKDSDGKPATNLGRDDAQALLDYLDQTEQAGHMLVAWNELSFDLKWIGHVAGDTPKAARIARRMCDPMFQFFMTKGFPVSLESVARGMGLTCRKLMDSADAPVQWRRQPSGSVRLCAGRYPHDRRNRVGDRPPAEDRLVHPKGNALIDSNSAAQNRGAMLGRSHARPVVDEPANPKT